MHIASAYGGTQSSESLKQVTVDVKGKAEGKCNTKEEICTRGPQSGKSMYIVSDLCKKLSTRQLLFVS